MDEFDSNEKKLKVLELARLQIYSANKNHLSESSKNGVLAAMDWINELYNKQYKKHVELTYGVDKREK